MAELCRKNARPSVGCVIMASGLARRFGSNKLLADFGGRPLLCRALEVTATPALAALVEKACWQSVAPELDPVCGTVGTKLELAHNAPTPVGMMVRCESELTAVDGRKLTFSAVMYDDAGEVGRATHERFIIQNEKFQKKADAKKAAE